MLFGLIAIVLIVVSAVVFSILGVAVDNFGDKCIEMIDGVPVWTKKRCIRCMSCVRCNAIQYGNVIKNRRRYRYHNI